MKVKECFNEVKNSTMVQNAMDKLRPTWEVIKNQGAYKILIISMLITLIFIPIDAIIGLIGKLMIGNSSLLSFSSIFDIINFIDSFFGGYFYLGSSIAKIIVFILISAILSIIAYIVTTFIVSNANFRSFKILAEEERVVTIGEYFSLAFHDIISYSWKFFINVTVPIVIISIIGSLVNVIPFIKGVAIANFITSIISYALIFRFFAMMLGVDYEKAVIDFSPYWFTFAIIAYLLKIITTLSILIRFAEMVFVLYSILLLTGSKYYYGEQQS